MQTCASNGADGRGARSWSAAQPALEKPWLFVQVRNCVLHVAGGMFLANDAAQLPPVTFGTARW